MVAIAAKMEAGSFGIDDLRKQHFNALTSHGCVFEEEA